MINTNIWTFAWNGEAGRIGIFTEKTLSIEIVYFQVFHSSQWVLGGKKWVVSKALLYKEHFSTNVFRVLLRAIRVTTDNREWQEKRQEHNILDVIFQKLLTHYVLHESSISKFACIKEIVHQKRYLYQNLTESHLNIKWQKTCLISGMKNGWHLFSLLDWTLSAPQITQINFTLR